MRPAHQLIPSRLRLRLAQTRDLDRLLQACLPEEARPHCRAGGISNGRLVVVADSAAWATRIRFQERQLLARMHTVSRGATAVPERIRVCVSPLGTVRRKPLPAVHVPATARESLLITAAGVSDPRLARALRQMARRAAG